MTEYKTIKNLKGGKYGNEQIVEISCNMCNYDRGILTYSTLSSSGMVRCNNPDCGCKIEEL